MDDGATCDPLCHQADPFDSDGHGTKVASVVGKGILVPVRISNTDSEVEASAMTQAVKWVAAQGIPIATIGVTIIGQNRDLESALKAASGTLFVVAAGDNGIDIDKRHEPVMPCSADAPNVICVTNENSTGKPENDANTGAQSVDLAADAVDVPALNTDGTPTQVDSSSYAAAEVTSQAVQLLTAQPDLSVDQLKQKLLTH